MALADRTVRSESANDKTTDEQNIINSPPFLAPGGGGLTVSGFERSPAKTAILLVDDDDAVRDVVGRRLEAAGYAVREAASGESALEAVRSRPPDLIVLDLVLGGMDGLAVLRAVRAGSRVPVIMLTSAGDESDRVLALELGADDYVVKPFLPRELVAARASAASTQPSAGAQHAPRFR